MEQCYALLFPLQLFYSWVRLNLFIYFWAHSAVVSQGKKEMVKLVYGLIVRFLRHVFNVSSCQFDVRSDKVYRLYEEARKNVVGQVF